MTSTVQSLAVPADPGALLAPGDTSVPGRPCFALTIPLEDGPTFDRPEERCRARAGWQTLVACGSCSESNAVPVCAEHLVWLRAGWLETSCCGAIVVVLAVETL